MQANPFTASLLYKIESLLFLICVTTSVSAQSLFTAYHTKLNQNQQWETESRTGKYADLIVRIDSTSELVFWRGNSYLPYWKTENGKWNVPEVVQRSGDGSGDMPDKVNTYSHVRLIHSNSDSIVVHWRYLPNFSAGNPKTNEDHRNIVDEVFTVYPNGFVRRSIREGDNSYDHWEDPLNVSLQTFDLASSGILNVNTTANAFSPPAAAISGNTVLGPNVVTPSLWWKFDEAQGNSTIESTSGYSHNIVGHKANWKKGVSGTALALDGYNTFLSLPNTNAPAISSGLTIEAWVALGAAPWTNQGIVHHGNGGTMDGYGFYIDELGELVGQCIQGGQTVEFYGSAPLPLGQWAHVAMVVDPANRVAKIFINGQESGMESIGPGTIQVGNGDIHIGSGLGDSTWFYTLDALLDEVRIYDVALSDQQILQSYTNFNPGASITTNADMDQRVIPEGNTTGQFGVHYEKLPFYDTWDQLFRDGSYADVVVEYDNSPVKTIFWRGASYSPYHTNGNKGRFNSEFNENFSTDTNGNFECCYEPMSDKQHLYSHARVVENTPARVVVHWRYPQLFPNHKINHFNTATGWGDWSDWYMYCYPDGMTAYEMVWWTNDTNNYVEWAEPMLLLGPGERPLDLVSFTNTVTNYTQTTTNHWDWSRDWNVIDLLHNSGPKPEIQTINLTNSNYRPVMIYDTPNFETWGPYNDFNRYNHWPVGQKPTAGSDDYTAATRTAHTALLKPGPTLNGYQNGAITNGQWKKHLRLEGMSNRDATSLRRLYRSWQQAPGFSNLNQVSASYSLEQRAFRLVASAPAFSFTINASHANPLDNPCFIVKNWCGSHAKLKVDGVALTTGVKQGMFTDTDGTTSLAIYVEMISSAATNIEIACEPTSLEEVENQISISLQPNPVRHELILRSNEQVIDYRIYDLQGKEISGLTPLKNNKIDVAQLSSGLYLVEIHTKKGKKSLKFVKQ